MFFSSDGASAVEVALKMAFQFWRQCSNPQPEKTKYAAYSDAYHGDTLGAVSVGGVERFHAMFRPLLFEAIRLPAPDCYRLPEGVTPDKEVITVCQLGIRASQAAMTLKMLGYERVRDYDASFFEWGNREDTPIVMPDGSPG